MFYPIFPGYITPCLQPTTIHIAGGFFDFQTTCWNIYIHGTTPPTKILVNKNCSTIFGTLRTPKSATKRHAAGDVFDTWPFIMCFRMCTASWTIWRCRREIKICRGDGNQHGTWKSIISKWSSFFKCPSFFWSSIWISRIPYTLHLLVHFSQHLDEHETKDGWKPRLQLNPWT